VHTSVDAMSIKSLIFIYNGNSVVSDFRVMEVANGTITVQLTICWSSDSTRCVRGLQSNRKKCDGDLDNGRNTIRCEGE